MQQARIPEYAYPQHGCSDMGHRGQPQPLCNFCTLKVTNKSIVINNACMRGIILESLSDITYNFNVQSNSDFTEDLKKSVIKSIAKRPDSTRFFPCVLRSK